MMEEPKKKRGFAIIDPERQREIARMGGKAVADENRSFSKNRALAAEAGRKGGRSVPPGLRSFSKDRKLAARAGAVGGTSVPAEKRSFSKDHEFAAEAGRKGGLRSPQSVSTTESKGAEDAEDTKG